MNLSKWALENSKLIYLLVALLVVGGFLAYGSMPKLEDPAIKVKQAMVVTTYPGASAHQVELEVTDPLEKSIREMTTLNNIQSSSYADLSLITVELLTTVPDDVFSMPVSPAPLFCQFSSEFLLQPDLWVCVLIMLFFDVFDSLGTIVGIMACTGLMRKNGRIPHLRSIMLSDALATVTGACLGCSTVTTYAESATGFAEGGRTGVSAFVVALCFTASLFLAPLFLSIPAAATAPVMVMAGLYLFGSVRHISLTNTREMLPAFLTILLMPVTGSITDGIIAGLFSYILFAFLGGLVKRLVHRRHPTAENAEELV